ncbi:MAG: hypothetical protein IPK82_36430 [Polyangiaceae bacterium]|nr:hypothetical protein [Polyangiaceae bacterium]
MLRGLSSPILRAVFAMSLVLAPIGCEEPPPKDPSNKLDPAEQAKIQKSRQKIDGAKEALDTKNYDQARKLLREAAELGVESHKFEIEETADRIDKRQAKMWANESHDLFEAKKCKEAFDQLAEQINGLESEAFTREIRKLTGPEAAQCASNTVDSLMTADKFADARAFVNAAPTKTVLGPTGSKKLVTELDLVIIEAMKGKVADDVKNKKWGAALEKVDAAVKAGSATDEIATQVIASIRDAAAPDLAAQAVKSIGGGDAPKQLAALDATMKLLRWETTGADGTPASKEKAAPDDLSKKRDALATWVEAQRLNIKMGKKPEKKYLHGKVALMPAMKIDAASKRDLAPGTELWLLGVSKDRALVADSDPGTYALSPQFERAIGWVRLDRLMKDPTVEWLLPDDQLKGEQVWGPLRTGETLLELGTVTEVTGKEISVKRLTDGQVSKHPRAKLRPGKIALGVKLTGVCTKDKPKVVTIDEIIPPGRSVKFNCEGNEGIKEEVLENLRTKVELLPNSK